MRITYVNNVYNDNDKNSRKEHIITTATTTVCLPKFVSRGVNSARLDVTRITKGHNNIDLNDIYNNSHSCCCVVRD